MRPHRPLAEALATRYRSLGFFEVQYPAHLSPVYASSRPSQNATQNSGPSGSLILTRKASSSSASYRFIPAHGLAPPTTCRFSPAHSELTVIHQQLENCGMVDSFCSCIEGFRHAIFTLPITTSEMRAREDEFQVPRTTRSLFGRKQMLDGY